MINVGLGLVLYQYSINARSLPSEGQTTSLLLWMCFETKYNKAVSVNI